MFDNGSNITNVSSFFAKKENHSYYDTTYILERVGGTATIYNTGDRGRIYTVPFFLPVER